MNMTWEEISIICMIKVKNFIGNESKLRGIEENKLVNLVMICWRGILNITVIIIGILNLLTQVQVLGESVYISLGANALGKVSALSTRAVM